MELSQAVEVPENVRDFYDRYPYPPPVESLDAYRRHWGDPQRRRVDFHLFWPHRRYRADRSILVAGCGTSQAAKHAMRWPASQVVGIDCSATSVRCTEQLKRKHGLNNLEVLQLDVERVGELGTRFDQIVCTGVLHHLEDPGAGLSALRSVLDPDGAMHLMVYAPYGRTGIYMIQEFCRRLGIRASDEAIGDLMASLGSLPAGHPLESVLSQAPDFQHKAAIADALLHPRDRSYSVQGLFDVLEKAGLTFGRWIRQAPYSVQCGVVAKIPQAARIRSLPSPDRYAAIELFRGTMARHSAVAYRNDASVKSIDCSGDRWLDYVPIRMPDTVCVRDRLPPGAAAVLINTAHTDRDLFLPIGAAEKALFDAIDGRRTIGEIAATTVSASQGPASVQAARTLFEKLWWHDQLVFDASC